VIDVYVNHLILFGTAIVSGHTGDRIKTNDRAFFDYKRIEHLLAAFISEMWTRRRREGGHLTSRG